MDPQTLINLNLSVAQINLILAALSKQPLESVLDVFVAVREQAGKQVAPAPVIAAALDQTNNGVSPA